MNTVEEMAAAIAHTDEIEPEVCRATARERFSLNAMVAHYLDLYGKLARA